MIRCNPTCSIIKKGIMRLKIFWVCILPVILAQSVDGFTNDTLIVVSRHYTTDTIARGDTLEIGFKIENYESESLYAFFISDQIPSGSAVLHSKVQIGGVDLDDCVYETGYSGEVYEGNTPHRWVFETPPAFTEANPIPPGEAAEIEYVIEFPEAGVYVFRNFSWAGAVVKESDTLWVFGYDDDSLKIVVSGVGLDEHTHPGRLGFSLFTFPNPFKDFTTVGYDLPHRTQVFLRVYDSSGRIVCKLLEGERLRGRHYIRWNRVELPSGVYLLWLEAGQYVTTRKAILVR